MEAKMPTRGAPFYVIDIYLYKCFFKILFFSSRSDLMKGTGDWRTNRPPIKIHRSCVDNTTTDSFATAPLLACVVRSRRTVLRIEINRIITMRTTIISVLIAGASAFGTWWYIDGDDVMFKVNIWCHVVNWQWMNVADTAGDMITNGGVLLGFASIVICYWSYYRVYFLGVWY